VSVTTPKGFVAAGVAAGMRSSGKPDVALVVNEGPLKVGVGVFTSNRVVAAPVTWSQQVVADGRVDAVVLNAAGANACTGPEGFVDTHITAERTARALCETGRDVSSADVAVCSTGLIGVRLQMDKLLPAIDAAAVALDGNAGTAAAGAIMTTDSVPKLTSLSRDGWSIGGMAKGAGMLAPGMATMLSVMTTDAVIDAEQAQQALARAVTSTFNRVDSDGCMSTNDTVLLLASGASGVEPDIEDFEQALLQASADLSRQLVADAEGATHDISVTVVNATTEAAAEAVARAIARSNLFKAAIFGGDPNWGRIISAAGTVPADVAPYDATQLDVTVNGVQVCRASGVGDDRSGVDLSGREVFVTLDLNAGQASATVWTNDLTHDYVHENSAYST